MDYKKIAETLIELSGGKSNISSVGHCATRLRFFILDKDKVDMKKIENTKPVLGVVFKGDELQIVLAQNVIPVYTEAAKLYGGTKEAVEKEKKNANKESVINKVIGFVSASVTPLLPGLCAGGMLKLFLVLATLIAPNAGDTQTYTLLSQLANVPFYFMPIFVAYGASKKLGATPLYAMAVMGAMVYPDFVSMVGAGEPVAIFGIPVTLVKYTTSLLPALLVSILAYYV